VTSPRNAVLVNGERVYRWRDYEVPSVTSILKAYPKEALIRWAAREVAEGAIAELRCDDRYCLSGRDPHLCDNAQHRPIIRRIWRDGAPDAVAHLKGLPFAKRDAAGVRGTAVHEAAETDADHDDVPENAQKAYAQYRRWVEDYRPNIIAKEFQVFNDWDLYGGSADLIAEVNGVVYLIDIKTSTSLHHDYRLQLAAYRFGKFCIDGDDVDVAASSALNDVTGCALLHLTDDGYEFRDVAAGIAEYDDFLAVKRTYHYIKEWDRQPVGVIVPAIAEERAA
jgi:hypothetical protein